MASAVHGDGRAVDGPRVRRQGPSGHSSARAAGAASTARSAGGANPTPSASLPKETAMQALNSLICVVHLL